MSVTLEDLTKRIVAEYRRLAGLLGLGEVPLDIYLVEEDASIVDSHTDLGTDKRNPTPGYNGMRLILPQVAGDIELESASSPPFPPAGWDRHTADWPIWRTELWHEVVHQYQHQALKRWNPDDGAQGHGVGWLEALDEVSRRLNIRYADLREVI